MPGKEEIERDPQWLPHRVDMQTRCMKFLYIERVALAPQFLADLNPAQSLDEAWLPLSDVAAMQPKAGPINFIFHTAFCRSTMLVRALEIEGVCAGLSEPGIFASLVNVGEPAHGLVKPVLDLLSRPFSTDEAVFVKPKNHANMLIPALLDARRDAKVILMTSELETFLGSIISGGLLGGGGAETSILS